MAEFILHIENGQVGNKKHIRAAFENLEDGMYLMTIKPRKRRSLRQNAYYWLIVCDMVKEGLQDAGYGEVKDQEDAHEVMKMLFLKRRIFNEGTGELLMELPGSTKKLTTGEMEEYMEKCRRWAAEYLGISIPLPNQQSSFFNNQ